jgi:hypothetical protein
MRNLLDRTSAAQFLGAWPPDGETAIPTVIVSSRAASGQGVEITILKSVWPRQLVNVLIVVMN